MQNLKTCEICGKKEFECVGKRFVLGIPFSYVCENCIDKGKIYIKKLRELYNMISIEELKIIESWKKEVI